ncbi:hypothetical protein NXY11_09415 [Parabacteroides faecis]|uniref:hypothetical protein n=1 Tax=Parabacteroides faecis TaxID=1217282 RepID=UPI0021647903|nr:hypothetical protein [Parabacteroides faecis]MCS2892977.1 hypothetical protein [Parabacteroides faecis]UVQ48419.1 hypothetical protein NXY11_09415 [Parabacteroides faecis]
MKIRNKLYGISLLSLLLSVAACTGETEEMKTPDPIPSEDVGRRDVLLTLKNQLSIVPTKSGEASTKSGEIQATKAGDEIATAAENKISALDIYVFGSKTEDGVYTYQERFCYRENSSEMPFGSDVTAFDLTAKGSEGKETTALLSLKKGLFVKLYCIANQGKLIDPATGAVYTDFAPLYQSNPGQANNMVTAGVPKEDDFKLLQSVQLDPASTTDILLTPLPMTGAYATPLDLTDFSVSARLQLGFRLTRAVARFDIVNDATQSKFTIQSVSMANGRKGVSFFPLTVTGKLPDANTGELITYPARKFDGADANTGISTGAFYTWPSPVQDGGYLILSGTYAANQTENIPVTYKIPFKPAANETGNYIEVSQNHRYTVEITKADEYHLDFTLDVADWTDDGSIDDYEPGGDTDKEGLVVETVAGVEYNKDLRTVTIAIDQVSQFTVTGNSTGGYFVSKYYVDKDTDHDWLKIEGPDGIIPTKANDGKCIYTFSINDSYLGTDFPLAFVRFTDKLSAQENILMFQVISSPAIEKANHLSSGVAYNNNVLSFTPTGTIQTFDASLQVFSAIGSKIENQPTWLTVSPESITETSGEYNFQITSLPDPFLKSDVNTYFDMINLTDVSKQTKVSVNMIVNNPEILSATPESASSAKLSYYDSGQKKMYLFGDGSEVKLTVFSLGGCKIANKPAWLTVTPGETKNTMELTFKQGSNPASDDESATIQIQNILDTSKSISITVYNKKKDIRLSAFVGSNSYTYLNNSITTDRPSITYYPSQNNYFTFKVRSPFGISASDNTNWINTPSVIETTTQSNGDIIQTYKVTQWSSISASTCNTRRKTGTITLTGTTTALKKYIDLKTEHITCNDRATTEPPKDVHTSYGRYWMTQTLAWAKAGEYNSYKNRCPEGWKLLSTPEITYLFAGRRIEHPGHAENYSYNNSTDQSYAASMVGYTIVSGGAGWFFIPKESASNVFTLGVATGNNGCDLRCWRDYNSSTDN